MKPRRIAINVAGKKAASKRIESGQMSVRDLAAAKHLAST